MSLKLIRGLNWLGDAVMSLPALAALAGSEPESRLAVLCGPAAYGIYQACQGVSQVLVDRRQFFECFGLLKELRKLNPGQTILFQNAFRAAALARLAGLKNIRGYARDGRSFLLTQAVPVARHIRLGHEVFYYLGLIRELGFRAAYAPPKLTAAPQALKAGRFKLPRTFRLALAPGAAYGPAKRYPAADFAQAARAVLDQKPGSAVILGGPGEIEAAGEVAAGLNLPLENILNLAGQTSLAEAMAVLAQCQVLLTNDSGLMHVAGALNVPVVAVFGPTNPLATGPLAKRQLVLRDPVPCAPCKNRVCPKDRQICFLGLPPSEVAQKTLEFLTARAEPAERYLFWSGQPPESKDIQAVEFKGSPEAALSSLNRPEGRPDLTGSFFMGDRDDLLSWGRKSGGRTVLVLTEAGRKLLPGALNDLRPDLVVPEAGWGLEWILSQGDF
ncbi:MAG: lipopolysaccharide heptosyltransferase II [Deltaproteobacteria bacterium]|nr:lipopolysaccharide heptosyltransferase II [Deltaproteobacteria bacterium]